jgi:protein-tyrosine-phosphatase/DNA-binding transcriptional ArsR family regulator
MSGEDLRRVSKMLDGADAQARAQQLLVLADPERLRVFSALAAPGTDRATATEVAERVQVAARAVDGHLAALVRVGLADAAPARLHPTYALTAEAWIRFARLLSPAPGALPTLQESGAAELPPVIDALARRLSYRFSATFSRETVTKYVADSYALLLDRANVRQHLPSLTNRFATDRLSALATAQGLVLSETPEVLFVCVQNAGRSQIAAALLRDLVGDRVHVRTAGSAPASAVDPNVVDVLEEIGVPLGGDVPKPLSPEVVQAADVVITMGCGDACPVYPGRRYMDWVIDDPVGRPVDDVRRIRDEIGSRVEELADMLITGIR